jgi:hypothetical protein
MSDMKKKIIFALLAVLVLGGVIGWIIRGAATKDTPPEASQTQGIGNHADRSELKSLVSYTVPDGWQEASCDGDKDTVYVLPQEVSLDCNAVPAAPISISIDPQGATDCSELDDNQNVRTHTCKSLDIDGRKSLEAKTEFLPTAGQGRGETFARYFIDTGKGVVKVEYRYSGDATYQQGYDTIAQSISIK